MEETKPDGRHVRAARTKAAVLDACRTLMRSGVYRPSMLAITDAAMVSPRSGFQHYGTIEALWREALEDPQVLRQVAVNAIGEAAWEDTSLATLDSMVRALVLHERHPGN